MKIRLIFANDSIECPMSAYIAPSQIAERQLAYFEGKHVLVAGEAEDLFPVELAKHCESVSVFTSKLQLLPSAWRLQHDPTFLRRWVYRRDQKLT